MAMNTLKIKKKCHIICLKFKKLNFSVLWTIIANLKISLIYDNKYIKLYKKNVKWVKMTRL